MKGKPIVYNKRGTVCGKSPGNRGKIPQQRGGKIRDYSWKEKSASTIKRILSLAFYGGGRILHTAQDTTSGNYELSFLHFLHYPPPPFNAVVPTSLSSLRVRVLSNVKISINSRNTYAAAREAEFVSFRSPQQKARVISNVLISINSRNAY